MNFSISGFNRSIYRESASPSPSRAFFRSNTQSTDCPASYSFVLAPRSVFDGRARVTTARSSPGTSFTPRRHSGRIRTRHDIAKKLVATTSVAGGRLVMLVDVGRDKASSHVGSLISMRSRRCLIISPYPQRGIEARNSQTLASDISIGWLTCSMIELDKRSDG